jgi:hypothetical protein
MNDSEDTFQQLERTDSKIKRDEKWEAAYLAQLTHDLGEKVRAFAKKRARYIEAKTGCDDPNLARELFQDAVTDTWTGDVTWDPMRASLELHLKRVIRSRTSNQLKHLDRFEIKENEARIVERIFRESLAGRSLNTIAHQLNRDKIASPRVGTRHTAHGWGASTIRAMLYNERYAGVWRFKEKQWVKVPGTNKRQAQPRNAADVMVQQRPELAIIDRDLWSAVQARLAETARRYAKEARQKGGLTYKRSPYLFSGLLVCRECGAPLTMMGSTHRYIRCPTNKTKGNSVCRNGTSLREDIVRPILLDGIRERLLSADGVAYMRKRIAEELRDHSLPCGSGVRAVPSTRSRSSSKMAGLADFIASGERSAYIVKTLTDLETFATQEREAIQDLEREASEPLRLPSVAEVEARVRQLDERLKQDPEAAKEQLRRWLREGSIRVGPRADGAVVAEGGLLPFIVVTDDESRKRELRGIGAEIPRRSTVVAGG